MITIHTVSPMHGYSEWFADLEHLAEVTTSVPAVMTGDFNASWWHPELRRLMAAGGWRDAHQVVGRGLSCSWPTDRWHPAFKVHPPFVRLDHALVNDGLRVLGATGLRRAGQRPPGHRRHGAASTASSALNARPRCDRACFSSSVISANVRPSPASGTNTRS